MARPRKAPARHEMMTRDELVARLRELEAADSVQELDDAKRLLHDLEVHQVELELQNQELRESQALLEESRARLADLYDFAPVVYITMDREGRIVDANLTAASLFGIARGKLVGRILATLIAERDRKALRQHIERCFHERIRVENEIEFSIRGKPTLIVHATSAPMVSADGVVIGCKTTLTDITQSRRAQEKLVFLAQASATLGSSFDYRATLSEVARQSVPVLADICIVDLRGPDGMLQRLQVAFADRVRSERFARVVAAPARYGEGSTVDKAIQSRAPLLFPECSPLSLGSMADGYDHELLVRAVGARSMMVVPMVARDRVHGVLTFVAAESDRQYSGSSLATARDLAAHAALAIDNARLYERAQKAIRAREDMLSFVSHDLRNPLMGIQLTTETLLRSAPGEERRKGWKQLERILRGARQMRRMIDDLLDVASLEAGQLTFARDSHQAARLVDDAVVMLTPLAVEKQITLAQQAPSDPLVIRGDRDRVIQVLSNLIGNAIKFTPPGGAVTVTTEPADSQALFAIRDTGPGIPAVVRPHIFERFWQAQETAHKGRGLGLFIAKGLIEAQGGAIWVDSSPGTGGTTFSFTLPLASRAELDGLRATMETTRGSLGHDPGEGRG